MGKHILENGAELSYELVKNDEGTAIGIEITGLAGEAAGRLAISPTIEGLPVVRIGDRAFLDAAGLTSVELPESVTSVGRGAFAWNEALESVVLGAGVKFSRSPFTHCRRLVVTFRSSDGTSKQVRAWATETLENGAALNYEFIGEGYEVFGYSGDLPETLAIPDALDGVPVVSIGSFAFEKSQTLREVELPDTVGSVGRSAFSRCARLESIKLPSGLQEINAHAFSGCVNLREAALPPTLRMVCTGAFKGCAGLTSVVLPPEVEAVGSEAFRDCVGLKSAELAESTTIVGSSAFNGCTALETLKVPGADVRFSLASLDRCPKLRIDSPTFGLERLSDDFGLLYKREESGAIVIGHAGAAPAELEIPGTVDGLPVVGIGEYAFINAAGTVDDAEDFNDAGLVAVKLPGTLRHIGGWAFRHNRKLASIALPDSVETIGNGAFSYCASLVSVRLPAGLTRLGDRAFHGCSNLESVDGGGALTEIPLAAFYDCRRLKSAKLPSTVRRVESGAFCNCASLAAFDVPAALVYVCDHAFAGCPLAPELLDTLRDKLNAVGALRYERVGDALIGYAQESDGAVIVDYAGVLPASFEVPGTLGGREVVEIGENAFMHSPSLVRAALPPTVRVIGRGAFAFCVNLESAPVPASVSEVGSEAFAECRKLEPKSLPETVTTIGGNVFPTYYPEEAGERESEGE